MSLRALLAVCLALFAPFLARAEEELSLRDWAAAPYWAAAGAPGATEGRRGLSRTTLAPVATPLPFVSLAPCRLLDTRAASGFPSPFGGPPLSPGSSRVVPVAGSCGIPPSAQAVSFNFTVTNPLGPGFLAAWPAASPIPQTSILNYVAAQTVGNSSIVGLGAGAIAVVAGVSGADLIIDVNGYYAPQTVVNTLNGLSGDVAVAAGANTTITPTGSTLTISSTGSISGVTAGTGLAGGGTSGNVTLLIPPAGILADRIATGQVVKALNGQTDAVSLVAGSNVSITPGAGTLTIASAGTITGVTAGAGLTGGGVSGNVPVSVALPHGRAVQTAVQSFAAGSFLAVNLDSMAFASGTTLGPVENILISRAGVYQITGEIMWASNATGVRVLTINTESGLELAADSRPASSGIESMQTVSTIARLAAGSSVHLLAAQGTAGSLSTVLFHGRAAALNVVWVAP